MPERLVLFHFHRDSELCRSRVRMLRAFNPGARVCGLFGGESSDVASAVQHLSADLDDLYHLRDRTPVWKKRHTDLAVRTWYLDVGQGFPFDVLHVIQWDLLLFDSLDNLYQGVHQRALGLVGLTPLEAIADRWWWTVTEPHLSEWETLLPLVRKRFGYSGVPHACLGPGYSLPRPFLDQYASIDVPELAHDELRLPLFGQIFGFELENVGFYPKWFDEESERLFNADHREVDPEAVRLEVTRRHGRRAFHPCRGAFPDVEALSNLCRGDGSRGER